MPAKKSPSKKTSKTKTRTTTTPKTKPEALKTFNTEVICTIKISQALLDSVLTDEWRRHYYNFHTEAQVAEHLTFNFARGATLSILDGFADRPETDVEFKIDEVQSA